MSHTMAYFAEDKGGACHEVRGAKCVSDVLEQIPDVFEGMHDLDDLPVTWDFAIYRVRDDDIRSYIIDAESEGLKNIMRPGRSVPAPICSGTYEAPDYGI